jgi:hypothetical protein
MTYKKKVQPGTETSTIEEGNKKKESVARQKRMGISITRPS